MPNATAKVKKAAENAAKATLAAKGIAKPKHVPGESASGVKAIWPGTSPAGDKSGVDTGTSRVLQSNSKPPTSTGDAMTKTTTSTPAKTTDSVAANEKKLADEKAAAKIAAAEKASKDKAAKLEADTKAKEAKALERKAAMEKAAKERETKQAANLEAKKAAAEGTKRTYFGSMTALAERVKSGVYTKGMTGQLRSSDELAIALDAVPTDNVIKLGLLVLGLKDNPYAALNRGQQSMNLRNKMRGAIKADEGKGAMIVGSNPEQRVTLDYIKSVRDANNFATAEDAAAKKAEAKAKREKEAGDKKAAALAEKAKATEAANAKAQTVAVAAVKKAAAKKAAAKPAQPAA